MLTLGVPLPRIHRRISSSPANRLLREPMVEVRFSLSPQHMERKILEIGVTMSGPLEDDWFDTPDLWVAKLDEEIVKEWLEILAGAGPHGFLIEPFVIRERTAFEQAT